MNNNNLFNYVRAHLNIYYYLKLVEFFFVILNIDRWKILNNKNRIYSIKSGYPRETGAIDILIATGPNCLYAR